MSLSESKSGSIGSRISKCAVQNTVVPAAQSTAGVRGEETHKPGETPHGERKGSRSFLASVSPAPSSIQKVKGWFQR